MIGITAAKKLQTGDMIHSMTHTRMPMVLRYAGA